MKVFHLFLLSSNDWWNIQSARCTLKTAYTIYIENVKTLEIGKDIRGIMCESMWCYQTRDNRKIIQSIAFKAENTKACHQRYDGSGPRIQVKH